MGTSTQKASAEPKTSIPQQRGMGEESASRGGTPRRKSTSRSNTPARSTPRSKIGLASVSRTTVTGGIRKAYGVTKKTSVSTASVDSPTEVPIKERYSLGIGIEIKGEDHANAEDAAYAHWTQAERDLFNNFADRGAVPLLPKIWQLDFSTMPESLFTEQDDMAFINTHSGKDFQAMKALNSLLLVGTRVRDRLIASGDPSTVLQRAVNAYSKWCMIDGGLAHKVFEPIFTMVATRAGETTGDVVTRITAEFVSMAAQFRSLGTDLARSQTKFPEGKTRSIRAIGIAPTLYGIIIAKSVLAVVTFDTANLDAGTKTIALFDFADEGQDVWNAFAVAILLITVRNHLIELDETETRNSPRKRKTDPDA